MQIELARGINLGSDDPDGWKKAGVFAVLVAACTFLSGLILPAIFLFLYGPGYLTQTVRNTAMGDEEGKLPDFLSGSALWAGAMTLGIIVIYSAPFAVLSIAGLGLSTAGKGVAGGPTDLGDAGAAGAAATFSPFVLGFLFVKLVAAAIAPMVILQFVRRQRFGDAFNPAAIFAGMFASPGDYAVVVLFSVLSGAALNFIPVPAVSGLVGCIFALMSAKLVGLYGAQVLHLADDEDASPVATGFSPDPK